MTFQFTPPTGLLDTTVYPAKPVSETAARQQFMDLFNQVGTGITALQADIATAYASNFKTASNDWGAAINSAIASISAGKVIIPIGTLNVSTTINLKSNIVLQGQGKTATILNYTGTGVCITAIGTSSTIMQDMGLFDMSVQGTSSAVVGFDIAFASSIMAQRCEFNYFQNGVYIGYSWVITFLNCSFLSNTQYGVICDKSRNAATMTDDQNAIIFDQNCQFLSNGVGFLLKGGINNKILNSTLEGNKSQAVILNKAYDFIIENNYFENNGITNVKETITVDGLVGNFGYNLVIRKNRIFGSNLAAPNATYGINLINAGYNAFIQENSFGNNKAGHINVQAGFYIRISKQYVSGTDPLVVGYREYVNTLNNIMQFEPNSKFTSDITSGSATDLYSVYPYYDANGEYRFRFYEYTSNQYQARDLDSFQKAVVLPAANAARRYQSTVVTGASGSPDKLYWNRKNAADAYEWGQLSNFVAVPASATAAGVPGDWSADASFLYVCHANNTWKRVAIAAW